LENRVNQLEIKIANLKVDFKNLGMIYNNSTCCNENQLVAKCCENCTLLENKVKYLMKTCARVVLDCQNCVFGRAEICYNSFSEKKVVFLFQ